MKMSNLNLHPPPDIRIDWETYNVDQDERKLVDVVVAYGDAFPIKDVDGNEVMSGAMLLPDGNSQTAWNREGAGQTVSICSTDTQTDTVFFYNVASGKFFWLQYQ